jgi:hypothetical protein
MVAIFISFRSRWCFLQKSSRVATLVVYSSSEVHTSCPESCHLPFQYGQCFSWTYYIVNTEFHTWFFTQFHSYCYCWNADSPLNHMWFIHVVHTGLQHDRAEVVESLRSLSQQDIFRSLEACPWKGLMWISWDFSWFPFTVWLLVQCHHFLSYTPVIWCHLPELGDPMPYSGVCRTMIQMNVTFIVLPSFRDVNRKQKM